MQKKTRNIIIGIVLIVLLVVSIFLILNKTKQMPQNVNELAYSEYSTMIGGKEYGISTNVIQASSEIKPNLSAGMIPIRWNGNCWELTTSESDNWYDYSDGLPAYIMLNDGTYQSKLVRDMTNKKLASENIVDGMGADIGPNDKLGSIYVWIPRFAYNENNEIIYINQECTVAGTWKMPSIFTYEIENRKISLDGIWVEYNPLESSNAVNTKVSNMTGENNQYGFIGNTIATNANNEEAYKTIIETYIENTVGADASVRPQINVGVGVPDDPLNAPAKQNRTILKIVDTNKQEPIDGEAYYDSTEGTIKIEVTYKTNEIARIIDIVKGNELSIASTNPVTAYTDVDIENVIELKYLIIDKIGNQKIVEVKNVFFIHDRDTLVAFRDAVNNGETTEETKAYQVADVKLNENKYTKDETTGECIFAEDAERWTPISDYYTSSSPQFTGKYYGNGHTISGLYINSSKRYQGLFGVVNGGEISGLGIIDSTIKTSTSSSSETGVLIAYAINNAIVENCYNSATVKSNGFDVGGIVGYARGVTITNCYNTGGVSGKGIVGGIVGYKYNSATITNCYNTGKISGTSAMVAGISARGGTITNCYNTGEVSGGLSYVAGISAYGGTITNCYNAGEISGTYPYVAGIARLCRA